MSFCEWEERYGSVSSRHAKLISKEAEAFLTRLRGVDKNSDLFRQLCSSVNVRIGALDFHLPHARGKEKEGISCLQQIIRQGLSDILNPVDTYVPQELYTQGLNRRHEIIREIRSLWEEIKMISIESHVGMNDEEFEDMRLGLNLLLRNIKDLDHSIGSTHSKSIAELENRCLEKYVSLVYRREEGFRLYEADSSYFSAPEIISDEESVCSDEDSIHFSEGMGMESNWLKSKLQEMEMKVLSLAELEEGEFSSDQLRIEEEIMLDELKFLEDMVESDSKGQFQEWRVTIDSEFKRLGKRHQPAGKQHRTNDDEFLRCIRILFSPRKSEAKRVGDDQKICDKEFLASIECIRFLFLAQKPEPDVIPSKDGDALDVPSEPNEDPLERPEEHSSLESSTERKFISSTMAVEPFRFFSFSIWIIDFPCKIERMRIKFVYVERSVRFFLCHVFHFIKPILHLKSTDHWRGRVKKKCSSVRSFWNESVEVLMIDFFVFCASSDQ